MEKLKINEILEAINGNIISGNNKPIIKNISTDSRNIQEGDLFIPLIGENFDGHDYISVAFEKGAVCALTEKEIETFEGKTIIKTENTKKALGDLALYYRSKFNIPFVAVTGSVGKTSSKEMIASVLGQKYNVLKSAGNLNNDIGLPLSVFKLESQHEVAVFEMGMSGFGEISRLSSIVKPDIAVITNIGLSHVEMLGSRQNILKAKMEIFESLSENGLAVLNGDDTLLFGLRGLLGFKTVFYGTEEKMDYTGYDLMSLGENGCIFKIDVADKIYDVRTNVPGAHNIYNALAAICVGINLNIPMELIIKGIAEYKQEENRMKIISENNIKIINDTYNASPMSMEAAVDVLNDIDTDGKRIAVLGDMLELGDWADKVHAEVGSYAADNGVNVIITVGKNAKTIIKGAIDAGFNKKNTKSFGDNKSAIKYLRKIIKSGDSVLVKGSRGMKMEEIVDNLTNKQEK